jgi:hypothetical protein
VACAGEARAQLARDLGIADHLGRFAASPAGTDHRVAREHLEARAAPRITRCEAELAWNPEFVGVDEGRSSWTTPTPALGSKHFRQRWESLRSEPPSRYSSSF